MWGYYIIITKLDNKTLKITPPDNHNLNNKDQVIVSGLTSSLTAVIVISILSESDNSPPVPVLPPSVIATDKVSAPL